MSIWRHKQSTFCAPVLKYNKKFQGQKIQVDECNVSILAIAICYVIKIQEWPAFVLYCLKNCVAGFIGSNFRLLCY